MEGVHRRFVGRVTYGHTRAYHRLVKRSQRRQLKKREGERKNPYVFYVKIHVCCIAFIYILGYYSCKLQNARMPVAFVHLQVLGLFYAGDILHLVQSSISLSGFRKDTFAKAKGQRSCIALVHQKTEPPVHHSQIPSTHLTAASEYMQVCRVFKASF